MHLPHRRHTRFDLWLQEHYLVETICKRHFLLDNDNCRQSSSWMKCVEHGSERDDIIFLHARTCWLAAWHEIEHTRSTGRSHISLAPFACVVTRNTTAAFERRGKIQKDAAGHGWTSRCDDVRRRQTKVRCGWRLWLWACVYCNGATSWASLDRRRRPYVLMGTAAAHVRCYTWRRRMQYSLVQYIRVELSSAH